MTQPIPDLDLGDIPAIVRPGTAPKPEPDYYSQLRDELHQVAQQIGSLAGTAGTTGTPVNVTLSILGAYPQDADHATTALVDSVAAAIGAVPPPGSNPVGGGCRVYKATKQRGDLDVEILTYVPDEDSELAALRARVAELEAQQQGGAR